MVAIRPQRFNFSNPTAATTWAVIHTVSSRYALGPKKKNPKKKKGSFDRKKRVLVNTTDRGARAEAMMRYHPMMVMLNGLARWSAPNLTTGIPGNPACPRLVQR